LEEFDMNALLPVGIPQSYDQSTLASEEQRLGEEIGAILISPHLEKVEMGIVRRLVEYRCFVLDSRLDFSERNTDDKFSRLIDLCRQFERCERYFVEEVAINATTIWRWATGRTRPSKFIGKTLATKLRSLLIVCIENDLHHVVDLQRQSARA
jgi:hypothetical protein